MKHPRFSALYQAEMTTWKTCGCALAGRIHEYMAPLRKILGGFCDVAGDVQPDADLIPQLDPERKIFVTGTDARERVLASVYESIYQYAKKAGDRPLPKYHHVSDTDVKKLWFGDVASKEEYEQESRWQAAKLIIFELGKIGYSNVALPDIVHEKVADWIEKGAVVWLIYFGRDFGTSTFCGEKIKNLIARYFKTIDLSVPVGPGAKSY